MPHRLKWKSKITGIESAGDWTNDKTKLEQQKEQEDAFMLGTIKYEIESKPDEYENKMNQIRKNLGL